MGKGTNNATSERSKKFLTIREVSEILGVHQETLRRWDREGKLISVRIGDRGHRKYKKEDIEKLSR